MNALTLTTVPVLTSRIAHGYEGLGGFNASKNRYFPYKGKADRSGVVTIGRGHVCSAAEIAAWTQTGLTLAEVDALYLKDMLPRMVRLHKCMAGVYTLQQFAAALSMFYNIEEAWSPTMTPGRRHLAGDKLGCAKGMLLYVRSNNQKQLGLWRRRMSEALCYLTGEVMVAKDDTSEKLLFARLQKEITNLPELRKKTMGY